MLIICNHLILNNKVEFNAHRNGSKSHIPQFIPFNPPVWQYLPAGVRRINLLFYLKFWDSVPFPARCAHLDRLLKKQINYFSGQILFIARVVNFTKLDRQFKKTNKLLQLIINNYAISAKLRTIAANFCSLRHHH